ncbi:MAG: hypothetical protein HOH43_22200, partial [Candidatus Latescibacteria bacterium]|nr:hypothetical protein [Candidatus Latescibacterota bacterium]
ALWAVSLLALCACGPPETDGEDESVDTEHADPVLVSARASRDGNRILESADQYLQLQILDDPTLLRERGEHFLTAGEFYQSLAELTFELRGELLERWLHQWRAGNLNSDLTPAMSALDAARDERWKECLELVRITPLGDLPPWLAARVLLAGARAAEAAGRPTQRRELLVQLRSLPIVDDADMQLARLSMLKGEFDGASASYDLANLSAMRRNSALVDLAALQMASGNAVEAFGSLRLHDFRVPFATEPVMADMLRKFTGGEAISLLANVCFELAKRDLRRATQLEPGQSAVLLGITELKRSEAKEAYAAFAIAMTDSNQTAMNALLLNAGTTAALMEIEPAEAKRQIEELGSPTGMEGAALQALLARELDQQGHSDLAAQMVDRALGTIVSSKATSDEDRFFRYFGALWGIEVLARSEAPDPDQTYEAINAAHDPNLGYNPAALPGGHLLTVMRTYRAIHDRKAMDILGGLVSHYDECVSAHLNLQYLTSQEGGGWVVPGDGSN